MPSPRRIGVRAAATAAGALAVSAGAAALAAPAAAAARTSPARAVPVAAAPAAGYRPIPPPARFQSLATPLIIGHRGAPGYRPEHTATGYALAAQMGADYLEPDLVPTKDGYLVDRHDPEISLTTDVADHPEFADLRTTKTIDGTTVSGWFTTDFTLAQLKTLRTKERIPKIRPQNVKYDGVDTIPTLQDDIDQALALSHSLHRTIGLIPEIKLSTYFSSIGLPMEQRVLDVLHANHLDVDHPAVPVVLQSFEVANLQWLHQHSRIPLMQLTSDHGAPIDFTVAGDPRTYADLCTPTGLKTVAKYATYLGPAKSQIVALDASKHQQPPTMLVRDAHRAHLYVTPYRFADENTYLPADYRRGSRANAYGNAAAEDTLYFSLGVDGLFADNPDTAVAARTDWIKKGRHRST